MNYFPDVTDIFGKDYTERMVWIKMGHDFRIPIGRDIDIMNTSTGCIELNKGDIIGLCSMNYLDLDKLVKRMNMLFYKGQSYPTTLSNEFIRINVSKVFEDITSSFLRDKKIDLILQ